LFACSSSKTSGLTHLLLTGIARSETALQESRHSRHGRKYTEVSTTARARIVALISGAVRSQFMARAIVRYSFNGPTETSSPKRTAVRDLLNDRGFEMVGTASREIRNVALPEIVDALHRLLAELEELPEGCGLDHLWVYVDQSE
jgi:hypothetical protein